MSHLKVCHILFTTEGGTWALEQLRDLRDKYNYEVMAVLNGSEGTLVQRLKAENIPIHTVDSNFATPRAFFSLVLNLAKFLRKEKFDIVQTHLFPSVVIGRIASWLADVPARFSMITGPFYLEAHTPRWVEKLTTRMDTVILPSCEFSRDLYLQMGISPKRLHVIYYGPDHEKFNPDLTQSANIREKLGWPSDTPVVGMVAYFYPKFISSRWIPPHLHGKAIKGHEDLIRAAQIVRKQCPEAKFLLIGRGWGEEGEQLKQELSDLVYELGLDDTVHFLGYRSDVPQLYKDLTISVQPSLNENLGGSIESLLMECPTVVTKVGGLVDTVVQDKTGVQVEPSNPQSLAQGIIYLLNNPLEAKKLGTNGRTYMLERFTLNKTVCDLHTLYGNSPRKGYRVIRSMFRFFLFYSFGFYFYLRFYLLNTWLPRWEAGWRPWYLLSPKYWFSRFSAWVGYDQWKTPLFLKWIFHCIFVIISPLLKIILHPILSVKNLNLQTRMFRYRIYAFIGRMSAKISWRLSVKNLNLQVRMFRYRIYASVGRMCTKIAWRPWRKSM